jgi:excinuclease UvrABC nuclease subunit
MNKIFNFNWNTINFDNSHVYLKDMPGLYVIGNKIYNSQSNLEQSWDWVYVGISQNLRLRLFQHQIENERKLDLKKWLSFSSEIYVKYFYTNINRQELEKLETRIIRIIKPKFNILKIREAA